MNRLLRVADLVDGAPVAMPRVLAPLVPEAYSLHWSILDLGEVVAGERWDSTWPSWSSAWTALRAASSSPFADLAAFAERVQRVLDGLFVGCGDSSRLPLRTEDAATVVESADMLVAAAEHGHWLISAPDNLLARYESRYALVSEESPWTVELSGWSA